VETLQIVRSIENEDEIASVSLSPGGKYAITLDEEENGVVWKVADGSPIGGLSGEILAFSPDGNSVLTVRETARLALWELPLGRILSDIFVEGYVYDIGASFSDDGTWLVIWPVDIGNYNKMAYIWNTRSGEFQQTLRGHEGDVVSADFYPRGQFVVTGSVDNTLRVWNFYNGNTYLTLRGHTEDVVGVSVSPDSSTIATISLDGTMLTWDVTTMKSQIIGDAESAVFGPGNTLVLNTKESSVIVYSVNQDAVSEQNIYEDAVCRNGKWIVQKINPSEIQIIDAGSGEVISQVGPFEAEITNQSISPNGKYLIVNNQVWEVETGEKLSELSSFEGFIPIAGGAGYFSLDGELAAFPEAEHSIRVWELATGEDLAYFTGHIATITSVAFSPDGSLLVSTSSDGTARVWDIVSGQFINELGDSNSVHMFAANFSPDGQNIVMGDWFGKVQIFEARTGALVKNFVGQYGLSTSAAFSPDGKYIITASGEFLLADYTTRIWEVNTGLLLYKEVGNFMGFNNASFSEDSRWAIVIDDGEARLISCEVCVSYEELIQLAEERLTNLRRTLTCQEEQKYLHKEIECVGSTQSP
jgi:WD40 repeat protein